GCPTGCTDHDDQALRLQAPQTVPAIALGTGQRRHQLRGPPRAHPTGPRLIGCQPPPNLPLEAGETHGRHPRSPDSSVAWRVAAGATATCSAPSPGGGGGGPGGPPAPPPVPRG